MLASICLVSWLYQKICRKPEIKVGFPKLLDGNKEYVKTFGTSHNPGYIETQRPHTTVLCCSDSRVPIEQIFNLPKGEVFVVREAGHVPMENSLASIEFSINVLGVKYLLILGHTFCGAVQASLKNVHLGSENLNHLAGIIRKNIDLNQDLDQAIFQHSMKTIDLLKEKSPIISDAISSGKVKCSYGLYDIKNGKTIIYNM